MKRALTLLLLSASAWAAVGAGTVYQVQSTATAANANGGGFDKGAANLATDLAATSATGNSPVVSSVSYTFVAGDANHWLFVKSGTNWTPGWYQITSVNGGSATLNAAVGAAIQFDTTKGWPTPKFGANTVAGVATTASPTGGTWGLDYTQADAAPFTNTNLASSNGTTNPCAVTSSGLTFGVNHVGNLIHITAGSNWTQGWYEIISVSGGAATLDRACGAAASLSSGTFAVGGAISLGSATANQTDTNFFSGTHVAGGQRFFVKGNATFTLSSSGVTVGNGSSQLPIIIEGYATTRGDSPTGSTRPIFDSGTQLFQFGTQNSVFNMQFTTTNNHQTNTEDVIVNCKFTNTFAGSRIALQLQGSQLFIFRNEFVSLRGKALSQNASVVASIIGNYIHDSDTGIVLNGSNPIRIIDNIFASMSTTAITNSGGACTTDCLIYNNVLYGAETPQGTGISIITGSRNVRVMNNVIYGFATCLTQADANNAALFSDFNDVSNCTTARTNFPAGPNDITTSPGFVGPAELSGSTATTSGSVLTQSAGNFSTVTDNVDYINLVSGTGVSTGKFLITGHTTTTVTLAAAPGDSVAGNVVWNINTGHNYATGQGIRALGYPGAFPAGLTTGSRSMGVDPTFAVQRAYGSSQ